MGEAKSQTRAESLAQLGFSSYREYLDSDLWRSIRASVFRAKGRMCCCCGKRATQIHHTYYSFRTLSGDPASLENSAWPVCAKCHKKTHFKSDKEFRNWRDSRQTFQAGKSSKAGKKTAKQRRIIRQMRQDEATHAEQASNWNR